jgi:signal transduction histidine kinase
VSITGPRSIALVEQADSAVPVIANTGPVVLPDQVQRLFEPFQRLHRISDNAHHGLGLSVVRAIAAAHAAAHAARSRPAGGLTVEIAFPAVEAHPEPAD